MDDNLRLWPKTLFDFHLRSWKVHNFFSCGKRRVGTSNPIQTLSCFLIPFLHFLIVITLLHFFVPLLLFLSFFLSHLLCLSDSLALSLSLFLSLSLPLSLSCKITHPFWMDCSPWPSTLATQQHLVKNHLNESAEFLSPRATVVAQQKGTCHIFKRWWVWIPSIAFCFFLFSLYPISNVYLNMSFA